MYCTMYKKVLYNIKKNVGGGEKGQYLKPPNTLYVFKKEKEKEVKKN